MKWFLLLALLLCGCMSSQNEVEKLAVFGVKTAVESAAGSTRKAVQCSGKAKASLQVAKAKSQELLTVSNATERPLVVQLQTALEETQTELDAAQEQLRAAGGALEDSSGQIDGVQKELQTMSVELGKARDDANRMQEGRDFWRASAWKLALLALGLALWTFRRPLLALCGGPVL